MSVLESQLLPRSGFDLSKALQTGRSNRAAMRGNLMVATMLAGLVLVLTAPTLAAGKLSRVHVMIAGKELVSSVSPIADDTEVYAPLEILKAVAAKGQLSPHGDTVIVTEPVTGRSLELALARVNGSEMIALSDLAHVVDGVVLRPPARKGEHLLNNTVYFAARVADIRSDGNHVEIATSFPVLYHVESPGGVRGALSIIDCDGAVLDGYRPLEQLSGVVAKQLSPAVIRLELTLPSGVMVQATDAHAAPARKFAGLFVTNPHPIVAHSVVPAPSSGLLAADADPAVVTDVPDDVAHHMSLISPPSLKTLSPSGVSGIAVASTAAPEAGSNRTGPAIQPNQQAGTGSRNAPTASGVVVGEGPEPVNPAEAVAVVGQAARSVASTSRPIEIRSLTFLTDNTSRARVELLVTGKANAVVRYVPGTTQMEIEISNAVLSLPDQDTGDRTIQHPLLNHVSIAVAPDHPGNVLVQIDTSRIVGYTLNNQPGRLTLDLRIPRNASGALSDKLVVVDPGHGGPATGAAGHGPNGTVYEKTITLAIAMKLRAILEQAGARVVVTRDSDVDIPLYDRPKLANTIGADLFISIHNDSTPHTGSASGTTTYYHSTDPSSRALAVCVQDAVRAVTGLPSKGALSDSVLYASGLAVLRNSTMPAVLCEVAYINNSTDRSKLVDPEFQQRVAQAMCDGLKNYVEGRPRPASKGAVPVDPLPDSFTLHNDGPTH